MAARTHFAGTHPIPSFAVYRRVLWQLSGVVPLFKAKHCLRSAGLTGGSIDVDAALAKYTTADQRFRWLAFVQALEKSTKSFSSLPPSNSSLARSPSVVATLEKARGLAANGGLPALLRVSSSSQSLLKPSPSASGLLRGPRSSWHPSGFAVPPGHQGPPMPRAYSSGGLYQSLSGASLRSSGSLGGSKAAARVRSIATAADARAVGLMAKSQVCAHPQAQQCMPILMLWGIRTR